MTAPTQVEQNVSDADADAEITTEADRDVDPIEADTRPSRSSRAIRAVGYGILLAAPLVLALLAGYLKYLGGMQGEAESARTQSVHAASDSAIAMLSYRPDTVQNDLDAAKSRMTGPLRDSYSSLADDVVAPAAIQKLITATATVPAASPVSASASHAVVLLYVDQAVTIGNGPPTSTNSTVRVTLDKVGGRWLVSGFDPV